jgi:hypothetical protein
MPTFARAFYIAYFFIVGLLSQPRGRRKQGFAVAHSSFNVVVDMFILLAMKNISVTVKKKKKTYQLCWVSFLLARASMKFVLVRIKFLSYVSVTTLIKRANTDPGHFPNVYNSLEQLMDVKLSVSDQPFPLPFLLPPSSWELPSPLRLLSPPLRCLCRTEAMGARRLASSTSRSSLGLVFTHVENGEMPMGIWLPRRASCFWWIVVVV